jgi:hypothetical protein
MELPRTVLLRTGPMSPSMWTPSKPLKAMTLLAASLAPPTMLLLADRLIVTPCAELGSAVSPSEATPIRFPTICVLVDSAMAMPDAPGTDAPEIRLPGRAPTTTGMRWSLRRRAGWRWGRECPDQRAAGLLHRDAVTAALDRDRAVVSVPM